VDVSGEAIAAFDVEMKPTASPPTGLVSVRSSEIDRDSLSFSDRGQKKILVLLITVLRGSGTDWIRDGSKKIVSNGTVVPFSRACATCSKAIFFFFLLALLRWSVCRSCRPSSTHL